MDSERVAKMAERIADDESDKPLLVIDEAIDNIIAGIMVIDENLPVVKADTPAEEKALKDVRELLETAVGPYMADIVKAMDVFEAD